MPSTPVLSPPPVRALAMLCDMRAASFKDVLPFIASANMIDVYLDAWHFPLATVLPTFELSVGDHVVTYDRMMFSSRTSIKVLIRSGLVPSKIPGNGGTYSDVQVSECPLPHKRGADKILSALKARCVGVPWYKSGTLSCWRFQ